MARYIINAGGIVHSVPDEDIAAHLKAARETAMARAKAPDNVGLPENVTMPREATPDEIAAYWAKQGLVYDPASGDALTPAEAAARKPAAKPTAAKD